MTTSAERKKSRPVSGPANVIVAIGPIFLKPCPIARATGPTAKVRVFATNGGALTSQGAPPLDIFHPTRQKRALGIPDRAEPVGWLDQHLLARFARLARYAVAQRVQNSRFGPHNGLSCGLRTLNLLLRRAGSGCGLCPVDECFGHAGIERHEDDIAGRLELRRVRTVAARVDIGAHEVHPDWQRRDGAGLV